MNIFSLILFQINKCKSRGKKEKIVSSGSRRNSEQRKESEREQESRNIRWNKKGSKGKKIPKLKKRKIS